MRSALIASFRPPTSTSRGCSRSSTVKSGPFPFSLQPFGEQALKACLLQRARTFERGVPVSGGSCWISRAALTELSMTASISCCGRASSSRCDFDIAPEIFQSFMGHVAALRGRDADVGRIALACAAGGASQKRGRDTRPDPPTRPFRRAARCRRLTAGPAPSGCCSSGTAAAKILRREVSNGAANSAASGRVSSSGLARSFSSPENKRIAAYDLRRRSEQARGDAAGVMRVHVPASCAAFPPGAGATTAEKDWGARRSGHAPPCKPAIHKASNCDPAASSMSMICTGAPSSRGAKR